MTTKEVKGKKFRGGGIQFWFEEDSGETVLIAEKVQSCDGFVLPLKKMRSAHAAMGRAIEAWEERER